MLREMREAGAKSNVISFNAAISACEKGRTWEKAPALLSEMREACTKRSVITFIAAISACEKGSRWEKAPAFAQGGSHLSM